MVAEWDISAQQEETVSADAEGANPMAEMLDEYLSCQQLERGKIIPGTVVHVTSNDIVVDVGAKCEGIVPARDLERLSSEDRAAICEGDEILVYVVKTEDDNDNILLSISRAQKMQDWRDMRELLETQGIIESQIAGYNKGGVIVQIGSLRGFVPGSQLDRSRINNLDDRPRDDNRWADLLGTTLQLKVIEVDQSRNRLILSERAAMREWRKDQREKLLQELEEGEIRSGRVTNIADFGAFVDIGGIDGLVHLSELSWKRVDHPQDVVQVGQELQVYVLGVDRERQRVALSLKKLQPDPWDDVEERYQEGQLIEAVITRLTKWGAFASIVGDEAIEGLIHISELDEGQVVHPRDVIQPDQVVTLRVLNVDGDRHRMALSLKQVAQGEYLDQDWQAMMEAEQSQPASSLSAALADASPTSDVASETPAE